MENKRLLFMRHGAVLRRIEYYEHPNNVHLTSKGISDLQMASQTVRDFNPDEIFVSPFSRTLETAQIITGKTGKKFIKHPALREREFSCLYGKRSDEIEKKYSTKLTEKLSLSSDDIELEGEEPLSEAQERIVGIVNSIIQNEHYKRVLFISHGGPHSWLICHLLGLPINYLRKFSLNTANFSLFQFSNNGVFERIISLNTSTISKD